MKEISVLFSGGPDSTLAALYALQKTDRVHLLTYHHKLMSHYQSTSGKKKHWNVTKELRQKYGNHRIVEYEDQVWSLLKKIYRQNIIYYFLKYKTFCIPWICGACKLAMHIQTIKYNLEHNIGTTYDGAHKESSDLFPAQSLGYIKVVKKLYEAYEMKYENPVYDIDGTDVETEKFGLSSCKNTKNEHVFFSTQHSCFTGLLIHLHSKLYYRFVRTNKTIDNLSAEILNEKIQELKTLLPRTTK